MSIYSQIASNKRRTWLIMLLFMAIITAVGYVYGELSGYGYSAVMGAFAFSSLSGGFSYFFSDKVALASTGAHPIQEEDNPRLYRIVENLCIGAGMPMPRVYLIDDPAPNAFATGRDPEHAAVAVTTGLLNAMDKHELEGVIAHELSHIKNYDIRLMSIVVVLVGTLAILADITMRSFWWGGGRRGDRNDTSLGPLLLIAGILLILVTPLVAQLIQFAVSRKREYLADASGALISRYPEGLARALEKIAASQVPLRSANAATAHLFIANPFKHQRFSALFSTHPPVEERIRRLRAM